MKFLKALFNRKSEEKFQYDFISYKKVCSCGVSTAFVLNGDAYGFDLPGYRCMKCGGPLLLLEPRPTPDTLRQWHYHIYDDLLGCVDWPIKRQVLALSEYETLCPRGCGNDLKKKCLGLIAGDRIKSTSKPRRRITATMRASQLVKTLHFAGYIKVTNSPPTAGACWHWHN